MQLYKQFFKLLKSHRAGIITYAIIGIVMMAIMFMQAGGFSGDVSFEEQSFSIAYIDNDRSAMSEALVDYLSLNNDMTDVSDMSSKTVADQVFFRTYSYSFTIPEGFENSAINEVNDVDITYYSGTQGGISTYAINNQVNMFIKIYCEYIKLGKSSADAKSLTMDSLNNKTSVELFKNGGSSSSNDLAMTMLYNGTTYYAFILLGMLGASCGTVILISSEKAIAERIDAAPLKRSNRTISNYLGIVSVALFLWVLMSIAQTAIGYGTEFFEQNCVVIYINTFVVTLCSCSIAILISCFKVDDQFQNMLVNIVSMGLSFLGGIFVPLWYISDDIANASRFTPFYWFSYVNTMLIGKFEYSETKVWQCIGVEILFTILIAAISVLINVSRKGTNRKIRLLPVHK